MGLPSAQPAAGWLNVVADPIRLHIFRSLAEVTEATAADLAERGHISNQTVRRHLEVLVNLEVIHERPGESDGETPGRPPSRFSLPAEVRESVRSVLRIAR